MTERGEQLLPNVDAIRDEYYKVKPDVLPGMLPLEQYEAWVAQLDVEPMQLDASQNYDLGWIKFEHTLAMRRDRGVKPKIITSKIKEAQAHFVAVMDNTGAPVSLRSQARVAAASMPTHEEWVRGLPIGVTNKQHIPLLKGIQAAGLELLDNYDPEHDEYMRSLVAMYLFGELINQDAWFLPAPPRQQWHINAVAHELGTPGEKLRVGSDDTKGPSDDGHIVLPQRLVGNDMWGQLSDAHATLRVLTKVRAGFHKPLRPASDMELVYKALETIGDGMIQEFNQQSRVLRGRRTDKQKEQEANPGYNMGPEANWYLAQPSGTLDSLDTDQLGKTMQQLEDRADTLHPSERHVLGWMQLEYAQLLIARADQAQCPAAIEQAQERFDAAMTSFIAVAESMLQQKRYGEACDVLLDIEAVPVYRALFSRLPGDISALPQLQSTIDTYVRKIAALNQRIRESERLVKYDDKQLGQLHGAIARACLSLMITGADIETGHHLALPTTLRRGGEHGTVDMAVFTSAFEDWYDTNPVHISFGEVDDITITSGHVRMNFTPVLPNLAQPLYVFNKLAAVVRAAKPGAKKQEVRGKKIDEQSLKLSDAVVDADEL